jgi:hypothetical protein
MKKKLLFLFSGFLFLLLSISIGRAESTSLTSQPPMAPDVQVEAPDPGLPTEVKAFSGKWRGRWFDPGGGLIQGLNAIIVVEKIIDPENAIIINAWGDSPERNVKKGVFKYKARIGKNLQGVTELSYSTRSGRNFRFTVSPEGRLHGTTKTIGMPSYIEMDRFE